MVYWQEYWINNKLHREDGPAVIVYYEDGQIKRIEYWVNNQLHKLDGPAFIWYKENGTVEEESYFVDGKRYFDIFLYSTAVGCFKGE